MVERDSCTVPGSPPSLVATSCSVPPGETVWRLPISIVSMGIIHIYIYIYSWLLWCGIYNMFIHIYTLHYFTLHCIPVHCTALHCSALHYITLHTNIQTYRHTDIQTYRHTDIHTYIHTYSTLHCIALQLHYIALQCIALHYIALYYITVQYITYICIHIYMIIM